MKRLSLVVVFIILFPGPSFAFLISTTEFEGFHYHCSTTGFGTWGNNTDAEIWFGIQKESGDPDVDFLQFEITHFQTLSISEFFSGDEIPEYTFEFDPMLPPVQAAEIINVPIGETFCFSVPIYYELPYPIFTDPYSTVGDWVEIRHCWWMEARLVPEPSTLALLLTVFPLLILYSRLRKPHHHRQVQT